MPLETGTHLLPEQHSPTLERLHLEIGSTLQVEGSGMEVLELPLQALLELRNRPLLLETELETTTRNPGSRMLQMEVRRGLQ